MQKPSAHFRNKFYLYRTKILISISFLFLTQLLLAQPPEMNEYSRDPKEKIINLPRYDEKKLHYGFFLALNYNRVIISESEYFVNSNTIKSVSPVAKLDFSLGFLLNIRLHDQLAFRIVPSVGFYDRALNYTFYGKDGISDSTSRFSEQVVETAMIETSFLLKYKSLRRKNHRFYLIGGLKPGIRAGGKKANKSENRMGFGKVDLAIEYGIGIDFYFKFFKFAPELRFSNGIINMNTTDINSYNQSLDKMLTHTVTLYFFFE